jgi:AcrR family transcriptional regulator
MPPPISFSQETILNEALEIVRKEGVAGLTARRIARNLNCSTQPVYSAYGSMQELQQAVLLKARDYAVNYLLQGPDDNGHFFAIGMQYFRFAQQEPELFKWLFLSPQSADDEQDIFAPPLLVERMKLDGHLQNLDEISLKRLLSNMWIYTHGLATLAQASARVHSEEFARERLLQMGEILIIWEQLQQQGIDPSKTGMDIIRETSNWKNQP